MKVIVNGESHEVAEGQTIAALLSQLGVRPQHCAVEVNLELIPRARHEEHQLAAGDRLEVVTLVGGG